MKRAGVIAIYIVGAISIGYLALYAWTMFTRPQIEPGAPIRIFEKDDAPRHSSAHPVRFSSTRSWPGSPPIPRG